MLYHFHMQNEGHTASLFADFFAFFLLTLHLEIMQY